MKNSPLRRAAKDIATYFPSKVLLSLTGFITVPVYARLFDLDEYGVLALVQSITSVGGIVVGTWLTSSVVRFFPHYERKGSLPRFFSTLMFAYLISLLALSMLAAPAAWIAKPYLSEEVYALLPIAGIMVVLSTLLTIFQTVFRSAQNAGMYVGVDLFRKYMGFALGLLFVFGFGYRIEGILLGNLGAILLATFWSAFQLFKSSGISSLAASEISIPSLKEFATYGLPGGVATIGAWVLALSDRYILEAYQSTAEVGLYSMGYSLSEMSIKLVATSFALAVGPIVVNAWEGEDKPATTNIIKQLTRTILALLIPMAVGTTVLAQPILKVIASEKYLPAAPILPWVGVGVLFYSLKDLAYQGLVLYKKSMIVAFNTILAAVANVVLNLIFVPRFGFIAAAINTTVSYALVLLLNTFTSRVYLKWSFPWKSLLNIAIASGVMALVLALIEPAIDFGIVQLLACIALGAGIYAVVLFGVGEFSKLERQLAKDWLAAMWNGIVKRRSASE